MFDIESLFIIFRPIFYFFYNVVNFFQRSVWDVLSEDVFNDWVIYLLELFPNIENKLDQFTILELTLSSGLILVIIVSVINFFIDNVIPN